MFRHFVCVLVPVCVLLSLSTAIYMSAFLSMCWCRHVHLTHCVAVPVCQYLSLRAAVHVLTFVNVSWFLHVHILVCTSILLSTFRIMWWCLYVISVIV